MILREKKIFIRIFILLAILPIVMLVSFFMTHMNHPQYCSQNWKSVKYNKVLHITLMPTKYEFYSEDKTISKKLEISDSKIIKSIVSSMDGKYNWWNFMSNFSKWSSRKNLNIKIETTNNQIFIFRIAFYSDDSFVWYSEIYSKSYSKPGDLQKIYGGTNASKELCEIINKLLQDKNITWISAYHK